jgi:hypothetical protein
VLFLQPFEIKKWLLILQPTIQSSPKGHRNMTQADYQSSTNSPCRAVSGALLASSPPTEMMNVAGVGFPKPSSSPRAKPSGVIAFETSWEFARQKSEAEFEVLLQEFCQFARLGFTILNQSKSQLVEVADLLRSLRRQRRGGSAQISC